MKLVGRNIRNFDPIRMNLPKSDKDSAPMSLSLSMLDDDVIQVVKNLKIASRTITYTVSRALAYCAIDLLAKAQPRVPIDTGDLRLSGIVTFFYGGSGSSGYGVDIAHGQVDGTVEVDMDKISSNRLTSGRQIKKFDAIIHYFRENEEGQDIALWTHEALQPADQRGSGRGPFAVKSGTGPKYLEIPFLENTLDYIKILKKAVTEDSLQNIRKISKTVKAKRGKYSVDQVELVEGKIKSLGYFGR